MPRTARKDADLAQSRNRLLLETARAAGLLGARKNARLSGRISADLIEAAKEKAHVSSDTELLEIALARLALEDDFGPKLLRRKGRISKKVDLEF